jgi:hypothetical protein
MMKARLLILFFLFCHPLFSQQLKSVIYDFDGLDIGQTDLPEGDYKNYDLSYQVAANPLTAGGLLGDRVLRLDLAWSLGKGEFGKGVSKYIELNAVADDLNFFIYNPLTNTGPAIAEVVIKEDDNKSGAYESVSDDRWSKTITIAKSSAWQLISLPLNSFTDDNAGGNGVFDAGYTGDVGKVLTVSIIFHKPLPSAAADTYFMDMLAFSEGSLPHAAADITELPPADPGDHCDLGCLAYRSPADAIPAEVEAMFPPLNRISYINLFIPLSYAGTVPDAFPGSSVQGLLDQDVRPVITWEIKYNALPALDPAQPRLNDLISGAYDDYIDDFADKIKSYNDTIIIRLFHEFDGTWYPWSISQNGADPALFKNAWRYIVDRFNVRGADKVLWMWCPNSNPSPYTVYNWILDAYPGDTYVDIVATDVYNHATPGIPDWRSFRYVAAETYYYLTNYFPSKPFFICELASRERYALEDTGSQTKAEWICAMSQDLSSLFSKTKAIIFFSRTKEHDWRINSSVAAQEAFRECIWEESFFSELAAGISEMPVNSAEPLLFPNPSGNEFTLQLPFSAGIIITDVSGKVIEERANCNGIKFAKSYAPGIYFVRIISDNGQLVLKALKK